MSASSTTRVQINGENATVDALRVAAQLNYGHFTAMQVSAGGVRGLDLHLRRLAESTVELFGHSLDIVRTRDWMRRIAGDTGESLSMRVHVFSRAFDRDRPARPAKPDVLITVGPARQIPDVGVRIASVRHARELPHIKHVGTFGLFHQKRLAQARGFDDVVFVDADGNISEGSVWNIGFTRSGRVFWPDAPALAGISLQLLKLGLAARGADVTSSPIALQDLPTFDGAFFTNSARAVLPITRIDDVEFAVDAVMTGVLQACHDGHPLQAI